MEAIRDYEKQVYAGVLGKVIGVYMGRPFEGWHKDRLTEKWGEIDRYVHEDQNVPLVVADDDITGTFTFIRYGLENERKIFECLYGSNWAMEPGYPSIRLKNLIAELVVRMLIGQVSCFHSRMVTFKEAVQAEP